MRGTSPAPEPEELARWLLASAGGADDDLKEQTMAAAQTYERLRTHLTIFLGRQGFDALWVRTLHLVRRAFPWDDRTSVALNGAPQHHLDMVVQGRDTAEARAVLLAVFSQFLTLLFTFIGADLGFRLLQQHWPTLPVPHAASTQDERASQ